MMNDISKQLFSKLESIEELLQSKLVIDLYNLGLSQNEIGKRLKIRTAKVNALLKGVKKKNNYD